MSKFSRAALPVLLVSMLLLAACRNNDSVFAAPVAPTATQSANAPTRTSQPTRTPAPTHTPKPTNTPAPTSTPTMTPTPTPISGAACLPGTWQVLDLSSYVASLGVQGQVLSESGPVTYRFDASGQAHVTVDNFAMKVQAPVKGLPLTVNVVIDGAVDAGYTATQADQLAFANVQLDGLKVSIKLGKQELFAGTPAEMADLFGISLEPLFSAAAYTCRADTLTYTPPLQNAREVTLQRIQ